MGRLRVDKEFVDGRDFQVVDQPEVDSHPHAGEQVHGFLTTDDPLGLRMVGPVAGIIAFVGFWLFRGYRLPSTVTRETVKAAGLDIGADNPRPPDEDKQE